MKNINLEKGMFINVKKFRLVCILLIVFVALPLMFVSDEALGEEGITLTMAKPPNPRGHPITEACFRFKELVEEKSNGAIVIDLYYSGELALGDRPLIALVQEGAVDIVEVTNPIVAGIEPILSILNMPYLFENKEQANKFVTSDLFQSYSDKLKDKKIMPLTVYNETWRHIFNSKRPIYEPKDLNGLKMRTMENPVNIATMTAMGANATPMNWGEVYLSLKNKTVDGLAIQINPVYANSFYETGSYLSLTYTSLQQCWYLMNLQKFNSLSPKYQEILLESAKEAGLYGSKLTDEQEARQVGELILEHGMSINNTKLKLFKKAAQSVYEKFKDTFSPELVEEIRKIK